MSKNIEIIIGMTFYPFLILKGVYVGYQAQKIKATLDKKNKLEIVKYFPKPVMIRFKDPETNKIQTIGEGNIIDVKELPTDNKIIIDISLREHTINSEKFEKLKLQKK